MGMTKDQASAAFVDKLRRLKLEGRTAIHDCIDKLLAERHRTSQKAGPAPDGGEFHGG
jgi:hypothetical protein